MRVLTLLCAVLVGVYCADQIFYSGKYTNAAGRLLIQVSNSFK
jgi:hypothetical protein